MTYDKNFEELMHHIAKKHGCTVAIDYQNHCITFDGPEEAQTALAIELDKYVESV